MSTNFSSLPVVDLTPLRGPKASQEDKARLSSQLYDVFSTTGFAYLVNAPLSFDHDALFTLARDFFSLPLEHKMKLAKKSFKKENKNTYRGYFPVQPDQATDNLKEGFEMGPPIPVSFNELAKDSKIKLSEPNVWPPSRVFSERPKLELLYDELQELSSSLLSLLAVALGKEPSFFDSYLHDSLSTLRLLHYPPVERVADDQLSCTPHTDSGILTLLHQDPTGGLEVRNADGQWIPAPYVKESIVVNIGDLMAKVSGGRFVATMHRVRAPPSPPADSKDKAKSPNPFGRFSVPFFFEPGEQCVVKAVDGDADEGVVYGNHVRAKMETWVEFQDNDSA